MPAGFIDQARQDSNLQHSVLETDALPIGATGLWLRALAHYTPASDRTRTDDPHLTMVVLYRLSYRGVQSVRGQ